MTRPDELSELRVSDADRNGTLRRLHNAVALGLIDITEFEERSAHVSYARTRNELDRLVGDLPGPGAIVTSAADRVELRGWAGFTQAPRGVDGAHPAGAGAPDGLGRARPESRPGSPDRWSSSNST